MFSLAQALRASHDPEAQHYQDLFDQQEKREQVSDRIRMLRSFALQSGKAQNWPQAIEQLQQAIELCGQCSDAALLHKNLAFFYEQTGRIGDAESELEKTLALTPDDAKARQALAQLRSLTGSER